MDATFSGYFFLTVFEFIPIRPGHISLSIMRRMERLHIGLGFKIDLKKNVGYW